MTLHISHNDLDGIGCGILVQASLAQVDTRYASYDDLEPTLEEVAPDYDSIIITDLGPSKALLEKMAGEQELMLIDHHVSTLDLVKYPFVVHAIGKSATLLTYEKFTEMGYDLHRYKNFVDCINDVDLWLLQREDSLKMNLLFHLMGIERFEKRFLNAPYEGFRPEEELLITLEEERRDSYIAKAVKNTEIFTDIQQRNFAVVFAEMYTSELGNHIIANGMAEYVLILNAQRKKASLRSSKEVDISKIAEKQGGGGHKNAAGFSLNTDFHITELLKELELIR